ncbi:hypothetical protein [Rubrivirga marina]|uniref:Uncharacterized protein n=1 Tax=Rubrivirga marina TaxID=1196024 RepID=A0A271IXK6_9BACT|nr:hypothetical protein [Rubrivirga marina]PAP75445.1 hypothetical protein BSZ37_02785 [Rubrivirga marina]
MILRRVAQHVQDQNWTAVAIDFVIVVVGVFLGIQLGNWNTARAEDARERLLLGELRAELVEAARQLTIKRNAYAQVGQSGEAALAFLDAGEPCTDDCWGPLVDFFHASQWQQVTVGRSTYDEMRRNGWPRDRDLVDAMEDYLRQADQFEAPLEQPPAYRSLARGLIPLAAHMPYWTNCFKLTDGEELYRGDCPAGVAPEVAAAGVQALAAHLDVHAALTEWAGFAAALSVSFDPLIAAAERAVALIDATLDA